MLSMQILMRRLLFIIFISPAIGLSQDLDNLVGDLIYLTGKYVEPAAQATIYQSSSGWFKTAKAKELWDLDISFQANA